LFLLTSDVWSLTSVTAKMTFCSHIC